MQFKYRNVLYDKIMTKMFIFIGTQQKTTFIRTSPFFTLTIVAYSEYTQLLHF